MKWTSDGDNQKDNGLHLRKKEAAAVIGQIHEKVSGWRDFYSNCGLSQMDIDKISNCFHATDHGEY